MFYDKLCYFEGDKIIYNDKVKEFCNINSKKQCVIISMLGNSRVGKSTFINGLLTYHHKTNIDLVKTSSNSKHCTQGIDFVSFIQDDYFVVILDCQGLNLGDGKNDIKLLSIAYGLSNMMIYHSAGIICNETLHTLTSLCLFADMIKNDIDTIQKPELYFRMRDFTLDDPQQIIDETFASQSDQYERVRGAIKKLFPIIKPIVTEPIGKKDRDELKRFNFTSILKPDSYGFCECYDEILNPKNHTNKKSVGGMYGNVEKLVNNLNTNKNISFKDLDYYSLLVRKRFSDFWSKIDPAIYAPIVATRYQKTIDESNERLKQMIEISDDFLTVFSEIEPSMLEHEIGEFKSKIAPHILKTMENSESLAREYIDANIQPLIDTNIGTINLYIVGNQYSPDLFKQEFHKKIMQTHENIFFNFYTQGLCDKTIDDIQSMYRDEFDKLKKTLAVIHKEQNDHYSNIIKMTDQELKNLTSSKKLNSFISDIFDSTKSFGHHVSVIVDMIKKLVAESYKSKLKKYTFVGVKHKIPSCYCPVITETEPSHDDEMILFKKFIADTNYEQLVNNYKGPMMAHFCSLAIVELTKETDIPMSMVQTHVDCIKFTKFTISHSGGSLKIKEAYNFLAQRYGIQLSERDGEYSAIQLTNNYDKLFTKISDDCGLKISFIKHHFRETTQQSNMEWIKIDFNTLFGAKLMDLIITKYISEGWKS
jgi:hypothetical protein